MSLLVLPALVAAGLLALAGAQKLLDPTMTVGALRALGLPSGPGLVRLVSAGELGLAVNAVVVGPTAVWVLVAGSYLAFAAFVVAALRRGTAIGSCGCFGRADTPPHPLHVGLDLGLAIAAVAAAALPRPPIDELGDHPGGAVLAVGLALVVIAALHRAFVHPPRGRPSALPGPVS